MIVRNRPLVLGLVVLAVAGVVLVATADDDEVDTDVVTTVDGVVVDVPTDWIVSSDFDFQYVPPADEDNGIDIWSVAWACPPAGCEPRSGDEWLALARGLPTFTSARDDTGDTLSEIEESNDGRSWVLTARTVNDLHIVNVAVFHDGADHYLACNLAVLGDPGGLDAAMIDACRAAEVPA